MTTAGVLAVVGGGGLLGGGLVGSARADRIPTIAAGVRWGDPDRARRDLDAFVDQVGTLAGRQRWSLAWCAGTGVVGTSSDELQAEVELADYFADRLRALPAEVVARGAVFFASSAGGLYAGATDSPCTEDTPVAPMSPYGRAKVEMEGHFASLADVVPVLIGRISNLYGPGQNLAKPQGLISQLCRNQLNGRPTGIYVPLETERDYIFVSDTARIILEGLQRLHAERPVSAVRKIIASGQSVSIAQLLDVFELAVGQRPLTEGEDSPSRALQPRSLHFSSRVWTDLDAHEHTTLADGVSATWNDLRRSMSA